MKCQYCRAAEQWEPFRRAGCWSPFPDVHRSNFQFPAIFVSSTGIFRQSKSNSSLRHSPSQHNLRLELASIKNLLEFGKLALSKLRSGSVSCYAVYPANHHARGVNLFGMWRVHSLDRINRNNRPNCLIRNRLRSGFVKQIWAGYFK